MWIILTLIAALMQTFRNALKSRMSASVSIAGTILARFIFAGPIVIIYLALLHVSFNKNLALPSANIPIAL